MNAYEIGLKKKRELEEKQAQKLDQENKRSESLKEQKAKLEQIVNNLFAQFVINGFHRNGHLLYKENTSVASIEVKWEKGESESSDGCVYHWGDCYRIVWKVSVWGWNTTKSGTYKLNEPIETLEKEFGEAMVDYL